VSLLKAMLDTNTVSALIRSPNHSPARERLVGFGVDRVCISIISSAEISFGFAKRPSAKLRRSLDLLLQTLPIMPFEAPADAQYGNLRAHLAAIGRPIGPNDLFIAAHALALDLTLITANVGEFSRVPNLRVENWLD
jgi:tRNA(fMet)-specific endonuclease VapC